MKIEIIGADEATRNAVAAHIEGKTGIKPEVETDKQAATGGHTPGPWETGSRMTRVEVWPKGWNVPMLVADCHPKGLHCADNEQERVANARLIASAPELLAALRRALGWLETHPSIVGVALDESRAAIAKAEGRAE